jgi:hypothetical protein
LQRFIICPSAIRIQVSTSFIIAGRGARAKARNWFSPPDNQRINTSITGVLPLR